MIADDAADNAEIMAILEAKLGACGYLKPESAPKIIARLGGGRAGFARLNTEPAFCGKTLLSVEEKRALKLNTRMKYYREFIDLFIPESLGEIEPKSLMRRMHLDAYYRVNLRRELTNIKSNPLGIREVDIQPSPYPCPMVKQIPRRHSIESVPLLPLEGCTSGGCQCLYLPVMETGEWRSRARDPHRPVKKPLYLLWLFLALAILLLIKLLN